MDFTGRTMSSKDSPRKKDVETSKETIQAAASDLSVLRGTGKFLKEKEEEAIVIVEELLDEYVERNKNVE